MDSEFPALVKNEPNPPGIPFTPPPETVDEHATDGEAMVNWKKGEKGYVIVAFEGKPVAQEPESGGEIPPDQEIDQMATY